MEEQWIKDLREFVCDSPDPDEFFQIPKSIPPVNKGMKGLYKHTEESKAKITGRPPGFNQSEEWKQQKSSQMIGDRNHFHSQKHTQETKDKIIQRHYKVWKFVSPTGETIEEYTTLREFCRKYSLERKSLHNVINGKAKHHKGWTVA
jgi:hypothetical protein